MGVAMAICGLLAFVLSLALTATLVRLGRRAKLLDTPGASGHEKLLVHPTPNIGGIAIVLGVLVPMVAVLVGVRFLSSDLLERFGLGAVVEHLPGMMDRTPMGLALVGCLLALHVVGLIDDRRALSWWPKLGVQVLAAVVMVVMFPELRLLQMVEPWVGGAWLSMMLAVLWFVVIANAMNFLDNMDGLCGGVAAVASALFLLAAWLSEQWFVAAMLALLLGALLGFLAFNFPWPSRSSPPGRARIFMGDGGSLVVGFLLAFLTVRTTYFDSEGVADTDSLDPLAASISEGAEWQGWWAVLAPLCVLAVPLYDLVSVSLVRISQGKSPLVGDQQHFSHRLRKRGLTGRQTLLVVYACTAITGIAGVLLTQIDTPVAALVGVQVLLVLVMLGLWEFGSSAKNGAKPEGA